uniref:Secreted protein n=1 Tax=Globodera pallida TaxID=36090 RepID=A0A183BRT9_GLOPA
MILFKLWLLLIALKACGVHGDEPPDKIWYICENDLPYQSKHLIANASNYPDINIINKALTLDNQFVGEEFWKALRFGAFMIDFDGIAHQIAALEIRQTIVKKGMKLFKRKWPQLQLHNIFSAFNLDPTKLSHPAKRIATLASSLDL